MVLGSSEALAGTLPCEITLKVPATWVRVPSQSSPAFQLPNGTGMLRSECSLLSRELSDVEFSTHIGEEEPEEAPGLRTFGPYRGRIWSMNQEGTELQWWLTKGRYMVHLTAQGSAKISEGVENEISPGRGDAQRS